MLQIRHSQELNTNNRFDTFSSFNLFVSFFLSFQDCFLTHVQRSEEWKVSRVGRFIGARTALHLSLQRCSKIRVASPPADAMSGGLDWDPLEPTPRTQHTYGRGGLLLHTSMVSLCSSHIQSRNLSHTLSFRLVSCTHAFLYPCRSTQPCTAACGITSLQAIRIFEFTRVLFCTRKRHLLCLNV